MNIKNATVKFLGDSITQGVGASEEEKRYTDRFRVMTGAEVYNYGISGTRIAKQQKYPGYEWKPAWDDNDFIYRLEKEMEEGADVIVIFGGTNDYGHGNAPFGEENDREPDSFIGACHYLFANTVIKYPEARHIVMTPLHREGEDTPNSRGKVLSDYVKAIKDIAGTYGFDILDLFEKCPIDPRDADNKEKYAPDGLHPSDEGHEMVAGMLANFIEKL